ncbi:hypothetical protein PBRA_004054 [Plasmodiophora brassicae]|nr:hypothetical protein PBRA_004054 [Plasmodiophora brassicae]
MMTKKGVGATASKEDLDIGMSTSGEVVLTMTEALDRAGMGAFQKRIMAICGVCSAGDAMEALLLSFLLQDIKSEWNLEKGVDGLLGAVVFLGVFIGSLMSGLISDKFGRWYGFVITASMTTVFGLLSATAPSITMLCVWRFFVGVGLGGGHTSFTLFTEFLPSENRGKMLLLNQAFWSCGAVLEVVLAWNILPHYGWRTLLIVSAVPGIVVLALSAWMPESPRYLAVQGRLTDARDLISRVSRVNGSSLHLQSWTLAPVPHSHHTTISEKVSVLYSAALWPTTSRLWALWFSSSLLYYGVIFLSPRFFTNDTPQDYYISLLIASLAEFPALLVPYTVIDVWGRRRTLATLYAVCAVACLVLTLQLRSTLDVAIVFMARGGVSAAFISLYVVTAESYPTSLRSTGFGVASCVARMAGISTSFLSEDASVSLALMAFATTAAIASYVSMHLPNETANKALPSELATLPEALDSSGHGLLDDGERSGSIPRTKVTRSTTSA